MVRAEMTSQRAMTSTWTAERRYDEDDDNDDDAVDYDGQQQEHKRQAAWQW
jgi:hypothetical protein